MHVGEARFTFGHPYSYPKGWGPSVLTFEGFSSTYAYTLWRKGCASGAVVSALYCNFEVLCSIPGRDECNVFSILLVRKTPNSKCYNTYAEGRVLGCHPRHWIFAQSHREVCRRYSKFLVISRDIKHTRYKVCWMFVHRRHHTEREASPFSLIIPSNEPTKWFRARLRGRYHIVRRLILQLAAGACRCINAEHEKCDNASIACQPPAVAALCCVTSAARRDG